MLSSSNPINNERDWIFYRDSALCFPDKFKEADFMDSHYDKLPTLLKENGCRIHGDVGDGKTWHLYATYKHIKCLDLETEIVLLNWSKFIDEIGKLYMTDRVAHQKRIDGVVNADVVMIDDLGVEKTSEFNERTLYTIVDSLYNEDKTLYLTTNLSPKLFDDSVGDRNARRINALTAEVIL